MLKITKLILIFFIFSQQLFATRSPLLKRQKQQSWIDKCCLFIFSNITNGVELYFSPTVPNYGTAIASSPKLANKIYKDASSEKTYIPFQNRPEIKLPTAISTDTASLRQARPDCDPQSRFRVVTPGADELFTEFLSQK